MLASGSSLPGSSSTIPKAVNPVVASSSNTNISKSKSSANTKKSSNSTPTGNSTSNKKKLLVHQKTNAHKLAEYHNRMLKEIDYKNDDDAKPPYSYAALICLSMKDTKKKMTLSQIYKWIRDNFAYYRKADKSWQVRKRHLLSLNKCFKKINRTKEEPGKGGFWMLDPQYLQQDSTSDTEEESTENPPKTISTQPPPIFPPPVSLPLL